MIHYNTIQIQKHEVLYLGIHFNDSTDTQLPGSGSQFLTFNKFCYCEPMPDAGLVSRIADVETYGMKICQFTVI